MLIFLARRSIEKNSPIYFSTSPFPSHTHAKCSCDRRIQLDLLPHRVFPEHFRHVNGRFALLASEFGGCSGESVTGSLVKRMSTSAFCGVSQAGLAFGVIGWYSFPLLWTVARVNGRLLFSVTLGMGVWGLVRGGQGSVPRSGMQVNGATQMNGVGY